MSVNAPLAKASSLLLKSGSWHEAGQSLKGLEYIDFAVESVPPAAIVELAADETELALVPLSGVVTIKSASEKWTIGGRSSVFDGPGECLYLPRDMAASMTSAKGGEVAICRAKCEHEREPKHVELGDVRIDVRGAGSATRQINMLIGPEFPAERLFVVEVWTPGGNWSSYPPHKHDRQTSDEAILEETYYFCIAEQDGFAFQRLYSPERDVDLTMSVRNGELLIVPWGYHTTCAAPGYDLYYLNVLAGPERTLRVKTDPRHEWILATWDASPDVTTGPFVIRPSEDHPTPSV